MEERRFESIKFEKRGRYVMLVGEWPKDILITDTLLGKVDPRYMYFDSDGNLRIFVGNGYALYKITPYDDPIDGVKAARLIESIGGSIVDGEVKQDAASRSSRRQDRW